jgi:hypothetical protein
MKSTACGRRPYASEGVGRQLGAWSALPGWLLALWLAFPSAGKAGGEEALVPVLFSYADPRAKRVCVAGTFNAWSASSHCLQRDQGQWSMRILLPPGRHAYLYVVDADQWIPDPASAHREDSGWGNPNSILIVE